jgi:hypothetical protein
MSHDTPMDASHAAALLARYDTPRTRSTTPTLCWVPTVPSPLGCDAPPVARKDRASGPSALDDSGGDLCG